MNNRRYWMTLIESRMRWAANNTVETAVRTARDIRPFCSSSTNWRKQAPHNLEDDGKVSFTEQSLKFPLASSLSGTYDDISYSLFVRVVSGGRGRLRQALTQSNLLLTIHRKRSSSWPPSGHP